MDREDAYNAARNLATGGNEHLIEQLIQGTMERDSDEQKMEDYGKGYFMVLEVEINNSKCCFTLDCELEDLGGKINFQMYHLPNEISGLCGDKSFYAKKIYTDEKNKLVMLGSKIVVCRSSMSEKKTAALKRRVESSRSNFHPNS